MPSPARRPPCLPCAGHSPASCSWASTIAGDVLVGGRRNLPFSLLLISAVLFPVAEDILLGGGRTGCCRQTRDAQLWQVTLAEGRLSSGHEHHQLSREETALLRSAALGLRQVIKLRFLRKAGKDEKLLAMRKAYAPEGIKL